MDPVTGLSRRQRIAIGLLVPLGIVGSTVATLVDERGDEACPDQAYECATLEPGEPIVIGVVNATASEAEPLSDVRQQHAPPILGHPVQVDLRSPGCSAQAAAEDVRELASDPPDEPPATLVIAAACDRAAAPMAQILSDSGITLITLGVVDPAPTSPAYHLTAPDVDLEAEALGFQAIAAAASNLRELLVRRTAGVFREALDVIERMAIPDGGRLLIPRTPLRDALIVQAYEPA